MKDVSLYLGNDDRRFGTLRRYIGALQTRLHSTALHAYSNPIVVYLVGQKREDIGSLADLSACFFRGPKVGLRVLDHSSLEHDVRDSSDFFKNFWWPFKVDLC